MKSIAVTVAVTPTLIVAADNINRTVYIHNAGGAKIYIGDGSVTTTTGYHIGNGESQELYIPINQTLYGVVVAGTNNIQVLTPDSD